jgi:prepilin-type N-terminal cleavage/methylation domain-containing protein
MSKLILLINMRKNFKTNRKNAMITRLDSARLDSARLAKWSVRQGFSFVEVMVVVFILSVSLMVFIQVISKSIIHSAESRNSIIAAGLAQEGAELIKNVRDNNWAQRDSVFDGLNINPCIIDYNDTSCVSGSGNYNLSFDGNFYNHGSGSATKFSRKITIDTILETKVATSYVIWGSAFPIDSTTCNVSNKCVFAAITLTKWGGE